MTIKPIPLKLPLFRFSIKPGRQSLVNVNTSFLGGLYDRTASFGTVKEKYIPEFAFARLSYTLKSKTEIMDILMTSFPEIKKIKRIDASAEWLIDNLPPVFEGERYQRSVVRDIPKEVVNNDVIRVLMRQLERKSWYLS